MHTVIKNVCWVFVLLLPLNMLHHTEAGNNCGKTQLAVTDTFFMFVQVISEQYVYRPLPIKQIHIFMCILKPFSTMITE